ncbi:hypothetical protein ASG67_14175 [Sphingomonas sp. Leaf339]|nr:hypothetical protein ASG67_14175 [Sphingomonas sp. Leaf339]
MLRIEAVTPFTEIRVLDAQFKPVILPANTGAVDVLVTPGLYEIGFRGREDWDSQHVIAEPGSAIIPVKQQAPEPAAESMPAAPPTASGAAQPADATVVVVLTRPDEGDLVGLSVELVSADGAQTLVPDMTPERSGNWCFPATAGYWRLRINEAAARQPFEMAITVVPGYVAQVSAPLLSGVEGLRVDLEKLRFRLQRQTLRSTADQELIGFEEAALAAISSGRSLFGPQFEQLIEQLAGDNAANPMLGVLAAHMCELGMDSHSAFRERLLDRLEQLTGGPGVHPDVAILRLSSAVRLGGVSGPKTPVLFPPILAASWRMLLEATRQCPELIPAGSLCDRIADRLWSSRIWTAWTAPPLDAKPVARARSIGVGGKMSATGEIDTYGSRIIELLAHPQIRQWFRHASSYEGGTAEGLAWESNAVTPAEAAIATALFPVAKTEERQPMLERWVDRLAAQSGDQAHASPSLMGERLGLPQSTVERALGSLADKLDAQASMFRIKS